LGRLNCQGDDERQNCIQDPGQRGQSPHWFPTYAMSYDIQYKMEDLLRKSRLVAGGHSHHHFCKRCLLQDRANRSHPCRFERSAGESVGH
jgi:hypothetical protein